MGHPRSRFTENCWRVYLLIVRLSRGHSGPYHRATRKLRSHGGGSLMRAGVDRFVVTPLVAGV